LTDQLRLMAVHAHPDDESSKGAATMAKYVSEGVDVLVVTCTGGERGSILNPKLQGDAYIEEHIHEVRKKEMDEAREILGVRQEWLGFVDSGLPEGDPLPPLPEGCFALEDVDKAAGELVKQIRAFRPQVITTYDENGGYPHPDHIMTHKITMVAFEGAADTEKYPEAEYGPAYQPQKLYYNQGFNRQRTEALHQALLDRGMESPYGDWLKRWAENARPERTLTTHVPCAEFFEIRDKALIAHATQIDPDGGWFRVPLDLQKEVWPTEEYELAKSLVDTSLPEDDLFAGVR
jgi:mycothiol S-conjugate amidase